LAATFDQMLERLDAAFRSQRRFLADTSHDLRTPLAVIRSNVDVLMEDPDATVEDWKETAAIIQRNAERMGSMIDDLLATARLGAPSRGSRWRPTRRPPRSRECPRRSAGRSTTSPTTP